MASFTIKGIESLQAKMREIDRTFRQAINEAGEETANNVARLAKEYCPEDEGTLADSIRVEKVQVEQDRNSLGQFTAGAVESYSIAAGGSNVPHALAVHEYPSQHNPPSWEGVDVKFKKGGPKFLERAMQEGGPEVIVKMRNKMF